MAVPGFQPFAVYDVALANLAPDIERRPAPASVLEALQWAAEPLSTQEIAVLCDIPFAQAREELGHVAVEQHLGADGLWTLPRYHRPSIVSKQRGRIDGDGVGAGQLAGRVGAARHRDAAHPVGPGAGDVARRVADDERCPHAGAGRPGDPARVLAIRGSSVRSSWSEPKPP